MTPRRFNAQADTFDRRAGLGDEIAAQVAGGVLDLVRPGPGDVILEIGAGTGEIGRHLAAAAVRYIGIDASERMLRAAEARRHGGTEARRGLTQDGLKIVADCDRQWPIADGSVRCVFASRALHLLDAGHVTSELKRIAKNRACCIIGRVRRAPASYKELLRTQMQQGLVARGIEPRDGRSATRRFVDAMIAAGATLIEPVDVACWNTRGTPSDALQGWREKADLAGVSVDRGARDAVLAEVAGWACRRFGDLDLPLDCGEMYTLSGVWWGDS